MSPSFAWFDPSGYDVSVSVCSSGPCFRNDSWIQLFWWSIRGLAFRVDVASEGEVRHGSFQTDTGRVSFGEEVPSLTFIFILGSDFLFFPMDTIFVQKLVVGVCFLKPLLCGVLSSGSPCCIPTSKCGDTVEGPSPLRDSLFLSML